MRCGNTLAHWFFKQSNDIYGGTPPSLDDIKTEPELVNCFVDLLFLYRTNITHKTKFKLILDATVLIFHDEFLGIVGNEPSSRDKDPTQHHFHHKIISVLSDTHISMENLHKKRDEVIAVFNEKNWLAVDVRKLVKVLQKGMSIVIESLRKFTRKVRRLGDRTEKSRMLPNT